MPGRAAGRCRRPLLLLALLLVSTGVLLTQQALTARQVPLDSGLGGRGRRLSTHSLEDAPGGGLKGKTLLLAATRAGATTKNGSGGSGDSKKPSKPISSKKTAKATGGSKESGGKDADGKGSSGRGRAKAKPPPPPPCPSLYKLARKDPNLRTLVAVQKLTTLNFFTPFGKKSKRDFTLLAPTDAAWNATFANATPAQRSALRDGFAALLLYHQILSNGYSAEQLAQRYTAMTALGSSLDQDLTVEIDRTDQGYVISGQAPNNYAMVVSEQEACGAHLIVVDAVLQPVDFEQLPRLQTEHPINDSQWREIMAVIEGCGGEEGEADDKHAEAGADADAGGEPGHAQAAGSGAGSAPAPAPAPAEGADSSALGIAEEAAAPAAPGSPPDCARLAAVGQLMLASNGTLVATGCPVAVTASVISSGTTQTVVSDAGQAKAMTLMPAPPPPGSAAPAARPPSSGAAAALAVLAALLVALAA